MKNEITIAVLLSRHTTCAGIPSLICNVYFCKKTNDIFIFFHITYQNIYIVIIVATALRKS